LSVNCHDKNGMLIRNPRQRKKFEKEQFNWEVGFRDAIEIMSIVIDVTGQVSGRCFRKKEKNSAVEEW